MRELERWELEWQEIDATTSRQAREDTWVEILAGLRGVEDGDFDRLATKTLGLAADEPEADLRGYLEDRLDEIWLERAAEKRSGRVLGEEGS